MAERIPLERVLNTLDRFVATQRNLPCFKTEEEHDDLREAARLLRKCRKQHAVSQESV